MSKNSSPKYYRHNKERLQKWFVKDIKVFLKKEKRESSKINMNVKNMKNSEKMKSKSWLSIEKDSNRH